jgi:fumarate reductase subunit C
MSRDVLVRRPYVRPMRGWWRRNPFFMRYMLREATALAVAAYAIVLAVGAVRLAQGEAAWNDWLAALQSPWSLLLHAVVFLAMLIHAKTWFQIMPKTMPTLFIGGWRVPGGLITALGWVAVVAATALLVAMTGAWR